MAKQSKDENRSDETTRGPKAGSRKMSTSDLPRRTLQECLAVAKPIHEVYAGASASWDEIASAMGVGAKSTGTKYLIWGAEAYELIYKNDDKFQLSETGRKLLAPTYPEEQHEAAVKAILIPAILSKFYSDYDGKLLPEGTFFDNVLESRYSVPRNRVEEAKSIIIGNAEFAKVVTQRPNGKKTIRLDGVGSIPDAVAGGDSLNQEADNTETANSIGVEGEEDSIEENASIADADKLCFFITPIGDEGSPERKHSDMLLRHLVEPIFKEFNISVVRADKIGRTGLISQHVFEHIVSCRFCVADMSFGNPNAFYELGVRHMTKLPTIQIMRKGDKIPFDVAQGRTIVIDVSDVYTLLDRIESARNELGEQIRNSINATEMKKSEDNPVSIYLPNLQVKLPQISG